jgi:hypothetical protein
MTSGSEGDLLYALPLEEFTKARDALATRLRRAGDRGEAASVKALKKPTTPAWAVNQLSRRSREGIEELIASADRLRKAQQELLHGGPAQAVWEATLAERDALGRLTEDARTILTDAGHAATRAMLDKISDTLAASSADPAARVLLRRGILTSEMHRSGFGDLLGGAPAAGGALKAVPKPRSRRTRATSGRSERPKGGPTARAVLEAERASARASKDAVRAGEEAEKAQRALERAEAAASLANKRAAAAAKGARAAIREAERARAHLEKLRARRG